MAIRKIVHAPAPVLEQVCEEVSEYNKELHCLIDDMIDTMYDANGVGLAAPQIGIAKRVAVVDVDDDHGCIELINPVIVHSSGEQIGPEGCLSIPDLFGDVNRYMTIEVKASDRFGKPFTLQVDGFCARAIQHEIDHLNGILFTSKVISYYEADEDIER